MKRPLLVAVLLCLAGMAARADGVLQIVINQAIHPITDEFIGRALAEAESSQAELLLIELRTPGGLEASTRTIVNKILTAKVPVAIWVAPSGSRAASAGFFILMAADVAAMAPSTNTGAAHPVAIGVEVDEIMKEKMQNDSAAFMRSVAARRGRNVEAAESAVRESISFTEDEALQKGLIDIVAASRDQLLDAIDGRTFQRFDGTSITFDLKSREVRTLEMTVRQKVLSFIMDPNVAFVLLSIGILALWAEFQNPGAILPGVIGLLAIILAVFALNILPTRYAALALILAAFALFALEAKFASHGIFGAGGVLAMFIGGLLLVDGPIPEMRVHWLTALAVSIPFAVIAVFLTMIALRARKTKVITGQQGMVGEIGVAQTALNPNGKVFVHGEIWNAVSSAPVESGARVRVTRVQDLVAEVEPV